MKIIKSSNKNFFKKDEKRYSWLCQQNGYSYSKNKKDIFSEGKPVEIYFNVINKGNQMNQKQILHINLLNNIISFLKPNLEVVKQIDVTKIRSLANFSKDPRRVLLTIGETTLEKIKEIDIILQDIKTKYLFNSAIYAISVFY